MQRNDFSTMHAPMNTYYIYRICMRLRWHVDVSRRAVPARVGSARHASCVDCDCPPPALELFALAAAVPVPVR